MYRTLRPGEPLRSESALKCVPGAPIDIYQILQKCIGREVLAGKRGPVIGWCRLLLLDLFRASGGRQIVTKPDNKAWILCVLLVTSMRRPGREDELGCCEIHRDSEFPERTVLFFV